MRILSVRRQFIADHSSTNYLFYAAEPLDRAAYAVVSKLSSHVDVDEQTAQITYHGDFADLGEERRKTFLSHYDVEVRESYDWWTLSVMLEKGKVSGIDFSAYAVEDEASLTFEEIGDRIRLRFEGAHLDYSVAFGEFDEDAMEGLTELGLALRHVPTPQRASRPTPRYAAARTAKARSVPSAGSRMNAATRPASAP